MLKAEAIFCTVFLSEKRPEKPFFALDFLFGGARVHVGLENPLQNQT